MIEAVHTAIESESVHRPTETLFHFLWQGAVIYLGIWFLRRLNRNEIQGVITSGETIHCLAGDRDSPSVREMRKIVAAVTFQTGMPYYSIVRWCK